MIDTTDRPCYQYPLGELRVVELDGLPHGQSWVLFREMNAIAIRVDLSQEDRTRALGEALSLMMAERWAGRGLPGLPA